MPPRRIDARVAISIELGARAIVAASSSRNAGNCCRNEIRRTDTSSDIHIPHLIILSGDASSVRNDKSVIRSSHSAKLAIASRSTIGEQDSITLLSLGFSQHLSEIIEHALYINFQACVNVIMPGGTRTSVENRHSTRQSTFCFDIHGQGCPFE